MTVKPKPTPEPEINNPRYAGATPEAVGRALLRHDPEADDGAAEEKPSNIIDPSAIQSSI